MQTMYANVDCANIYKEDNYRSGIVSQAVLWEELAVIEQQDQFSLVNCEDGYQGWISNNQINIAQIDDAVEMVSSRLAFIHNEPDEKSAVLREAGIGSRIPVRYKNSGWYQIVLPDGIKGWIRQTAFKKIEGDPKSIILQQARRFLGVPYFWGGKTAKGLDCSGFNQLLHKLAGLKIRRDSPMQYEDALMVSENFLDGRPGDLLFFAESGERITHVALKLTETEIIHARGRVKINSLAEKAENFDQQLKDTFVAVKTFFNV